MAFVPQFAVRLSASVPYSRICLVCDHPVLAASEVAMQSGMDAHFRYVNAHGDPVNDPHFDEVRMDALLAP